MENWFKEKFNKDRFSKEKVVRNVREIAVLAIVLFFIASSVIQPSMVPTGSMENTILTGDFLLVNKLAYDLQTPRYIPHTNIRLPHTNLISYNDPEKGDIVVFDYPGDRDSISSPVVMSYVKRCVATPGDTLQIIDKVLYVNGKEFPRPPQINYMNDFELSPDYQDNTTFPPTCNWNADNYGPLVIPKKGDKIDLSLQNIKRWETFINREYHKKVVSVKSGNIYIDGEKTNEYTVKSDYYFMMGDNRDNSQDSRFWGFVSREDVVGSPLIVLLSWNSDYSISQIFKIIGSIRLNRIGKLVY